MIKVLFVCLGNICRSPMAEFLFQHMVEEAGVAERFEIASAATSAEELGNPVHPGTKRKLRELGISCEGKHARQMNRRDYEYYDYLIGMDAANIRDMQRMSGGDPDGKIFRLLDLGNHPRNIADPWFTGNFEDTYQDLMEGLPLLLAKCMEDEF